jgi:hypothetical protein
MSGAKNLTRVPGDDIIDRIEQQLARGDRSPVQGVLATALACAPSKTAWQRAAKKDPFKYSRALADLHRTAGFADRKEQITVKATPDDVARELVAKYGYDGALERWKMHTTLPVSYIEKYQDVTVINGELA